MLVTFVVEDVHRIEPVKTPPLVVWLHFIKRTSRWYISHMLKAIVNKVIQLLPANLAERVPIKDTCLEIILRNTLTNCIIIRVLFKRRTVSASDMMQAFP